MGRTTRGQSGQIAGAALPRLAASIPAMNVPCLRAVPLAYSGARLETCERIRIFSVASSARAPATGPSISPTMIFGLPAVRSAGASKADRPARVDASIPGAQHWRLRSGTQAIIIIGKLHAQLQN